MNGILANARFALLGLIFLASARNVAASIIVPNANDLVAQTAVAVADASTDNGSRVDLLWDADPTSHMAPQADRGCSSNTQLASQLPSALVFAVCSVQLISCEPLLRNRIAAFRFFRPPRV